MEVYLIQLFSVVINIVILYGFKQYMKKQQNAEKRQNAIENGLRSLLRDRIIQSCFKFTKQGHVPIEELDNVTAMFNAYQDLNGNGAAEAIYKRFLTLPTVESHQT